MRKIHVITNSTNKATEYRMLFQDIEGMKFEQKSIDLAEVQELDTRKIIQHKLLEASKHVKGEFIIDDVSFEIACLNGFPGPLVKWMEKAIGDEGIHALVKRYPDHSAIAKCTIGYGNTFHDPPEFQFFEGTSKGKIVEPKTAEGYKFGFDCIFIPEENEKRFAEMGLEQKNLIGHRGKAAEKLKQYLKMKNSF